jgi:hypothetical protein
MSEVEKFDTWAVVELFGHQMIAGKVSEQVIAGQGFVRVDVPEAGEVKAFTKLYGAGAIYAISPTTEEICRHITKERQPVPISRFELPDVVSHSTHNAPRQARGAEDFDEIEDWEIPFGEDEEGKFL